MEVVSCKLVTDIIIFDASGALGQLSDCIGVLGTKLACFFSDFGVYFGGRLVPSWSPGHYPGATFWKAYPFLALRRPGKGQDPKKEAFGNTQKWVWYGKYRCECNIGYVEKK